MCVVHWPATNANCHFSTSLLIGSFKSQMHDSNHRQDWEVLFFPCAEITWTSALSNNHLCHCCHFITVPSAGYIPNPDHVGISGFRDSSGSKNRVPKTMFGIVPKLFRDFYINSHLCTLSFIAAETLHYLNSNTHQWKGKKPNIIWIILTFHWLWWQLKSYMCSEIYWHLQGCQFFWDL